MISPAEYALALASEKATRRESLWQDFMAVYLAPDSTEADKLQAALDYEFQCRLAGLGI